jgi:putative tryptophan/tyrosine transport system substrate-binding protein
MISRRRLLTTSGAAIVAAPLAAEGQPAGKVYRIGILETTSQTLNAANVDAFKLGLKELGYDEGRNLAIEYRSSEGRAERFPDLARELVRLNVDLIVTRGTPAALAAKSATSTIPVVMAAIGDPVNTTVVANLAHPGGNVTGLSAIVAELEAKRMELLKETVRRVARVTALFNMSNPDGRAAWKELDGAARALGIQAHLSDVRRPEDITVAFGAAVRQRADAVAVGIEAITLANRRLIADLALKHRLPTMYPAREFVDAGGLVSYGVSTRDLYRRAARFVDKIIKGTKPADLPVEQPTKFELVINLKTAKALGLTIPQPVLARADEVIQ